ncbi:TolC family protein [Flavobacterium johnsoniae]|uniref:TolC family protein n=1 Tax=Flavobacterium johnsoniae TaxID=986 RepID=UPI003D9590B9
MKTIILALLGFTSFNAMGQVQFGSLQEVLAYADKNAISIQSALHQEQIATVKNKASKTALLPTVNASAGFNDNITLQPTLVPANLFNPAAPEGTYNEYTFGKRYVYNAGVQANWDVINFQKWFDIKISQAASQLNQANTINTKYQVYNQLAQTYFSILLTEKYLKISKENIVTADNIYQIAKDKYDIGIFTEENLNRSKIQLVQANQQVSSLESSLEQLYNQLQSQLNIDEPLILKDELLDKEMDTGNALVITTSHPEVLVQEAQVQLSKKLLEQTKSLHYPTLTLGYQYNYNWATDKMTDLSQANNLPQQFWGLKLSVPIFNSFSTKSKIKQSKIQLQQEQMVLDSKKLVAKKDDDNLQIQYRQGTEDFRKQEEVLQLQNKNDTHSKNRYDSGIIGLDERLDKFKDLLEVQNQYMQSLSNQFISYYKLYIRRQF